MRSQTLPGGGARPLIVLAAALLSLASNSSAQSVSYYTAPDHNAFVAASLSTSTPLSLQSTYTGLPQNQGQSIVDGNSLLYDGANSFNQYDLATSTGSAILAEVGMIGAHAVVDSGEAVLWYVSTSQRKVLMNSYDDFWNLLWSKDVTNAGPTFLGLPSLSNGNLFYAVGTNAVSASAATGHILWTASLPGIGFNALTISSGIALASTQKGLVALNAGDGSLAWSRPSSLPLSGPDFARLVVANGRYACQTNMKGVVSLLDLKSGAVEWNNSVLGPPVDSGVPPIIGSSGVLVPQVGALTLLDFSGRTLWSSPYTFISRKLSKPVYLMFDDILLAGGVDGLYAISLVDGAVLWKSTESAEVNGLQYSGGRIYVGYRDGTLQVFKPQ